MTDTDRRTEPAPPTMPETEKCRRGEHVLLHGFCVKCWTIFQQPPPPMSETMAPAPREDRLVMLGRLWPLIPR